MHIVRVLTVAGLMTLSESATAWDASALVPGYDHHLETAHLVIAWDEGAIDEEGIEHAKREGERHYRAVRRLLGKPTMKKIAILLRGPAERPDGSREYPRVDRGGRIHLFQFGPTFHGYFGALPHEMVHSFRIHRRPHHDWFFEEGLAELVALRAGKSLHGFPWYDTPIVVAAGQWLVRGEDIPLGLLRQEHRRLNMPCKAQSYTLRSSFFDYLGRTYGDDALLRMAEREEAGAIDDYPRFLGKEFDALEAEWRRDLLEAYRRVENVDSLARRYREETPLQYMPVCREGVEF